MSLKANIIFVSAVAFIVIAFALILAQAEKGKAEIHYGEPLYVIKHYGNGIYLIEANPEVPFDIDNVDIALALGLAEIKGICSNVDFEIDGIVWPPKLLVSADKNCAIGTTEK